MNQIYIDHNSSEIGIEALILINKYKSAKYTDNNIDYVLQMKSTGIRYYKSTEIQIIVSNMYIES